MFPPLRSSFSANSFLAHWSQVQQRLQDSKLSRRQSFGFKLKAHSRHQRIRSASQIDERVERPNFLFRSFEVGRHGARLKCFKFKLSDAGTVRDSKVAGGSGLLGGAKQDFADEALRLLRNDHLDRMGNVLRLQHFAGIFTRMRRKIRCHRAGADRADANPIPAQVFCHALSQPQQAPLRGAINCSSGKRILARK